MNIQEINETVKNAIQRVKQDVPNLDLGMANSLASRFAWAQYKSTGTVSVLDVITSLSANPPIRASGPKRKVVSKEDQQRVQLAITEAFQLAKQQFPEYERGPLNIALIKSGWANYRSERSLEPAAIIAATDLTTLPKKPQRQQKPLAPTGPSID